MGSRLKGNSVSFIESMMMGVAGSAPASSIAIGTAALIGAAGFFAPVSLLIFAVPMLGIAKAYQALGERDVNAGASYQWTSAVFGPFLGFFSGWALLVATLMFMVSGSIPIATATLNFVAPGLVGHVIATSLVASIWFAGISAVVLFGITATSRAQMAITSLQLLVLVGVLVAALIHIFSAGSVNHPGWSWVGSGLTLDSFADSALIAVYFYWGWDVTSNLGEETVGGGSEAGLGGLLSIFITIVLYSAFSAVALLMFSVKDAQNLTDNLIYGIAVGSGLKQGGGLLASLVVILSSIAALEATMLMFSRTLFAMGRSGAMPQRFGQVDEATQSPTQAIYVIVVLGLAFIWASALMPSIKILLFASVKALGLQVDYYFGLAGLAAAWVFKGCYRDSWARWLGLCLFPAASSLALIGLGLYAIVTFDLLTNLMAVGSFLAGLVFVRLRSENKAIAASGQPQS